MPDGSRVPWHLVDSIEPKDSEIGDYLTSARAANDGKLWFEYDDGRGNPEDVKLPVDKAGWDLLSDQHRAMIKDTFRSHGNYDPVADAITTSHRVAHDSSIGAEEIFHALANRLRKADRDTYNKMLNKYDSEDDAFRAFALGKSRSQYFDRIKRGTAHLTSSAQDKKLTPRQKAEGLLVAAAQRDGVLMSDDEFESFVDDAGGLHPDVLVDYRVRDKNGDLVMEDGQPKLTKDGKILAAFVNEGAQSNVVEELGSARAEKMQQRIIDEVLMKKADKIQLAAEHYAAQPFGDPELRDAAHLVLGTPAGMVEGEEQEPPADPAEQEEVPFAVRREGEGEKKVLGQKHLLGEEHDESDIGSKTGDLFGNIKVDKPAATKPEPVDPDQLKLFAIRRRAWDEETTLPAPAPEAPEPPGTKPKETLFGMPERGPTGLKKSQVDEERARRGLAPLAGKVRGWGEDAAAVMDAIERDPRAQDRLLDELTDKPRALTSYDVAMLTHFKIELHNERAAVAKGIIDAAGRGDEGRAVVQSLQVRESQISDRLLQIERAGVSEKGSSSETGRGLAALRQLRNEDFSLASMETQERAARGGRQLTPKESEEIKHLQKKITEANERFDEFVKRSQAQRQRKRATAAVNQMAAAVPASRPSRADLQARREGLIAGIRQMVASHRGTLGGQFAVRAEGEEGPDQQATAKTDWSQIPGLGKAVKDFARTYIEDGMRGLDPVVDAVHKALGISGFTKSDVMDALSGYGKFKELSKDEIDKLMRDLQAQALNVRKLEDLTSGKPPLKTGAEREPMSDDVRRLVQKVNEAKRRMGVATTDPATQLRSALESVKTRLRNQISDLEYQIARREKIVPKKASAPSDAETEKLSKDRDTLRLQYDKIFGDSQLSDADRMKLALASVQRSIEELDSKIANRDLFPRKGFKSSSPALEAAKATRESRQADLEALRAADVGYQNMLAEKEHAAKVAALQAKIDAVGKKIAAGKTPAAPGAEEAETSPEIQAMEKQLKTLQGTLKGINAPAPADPAVAALAQLKARLRNRMAELATKMATNDYAPKPPAAAVAPDAEAISLLADKTRWEESFRDRLANIRRADRPMVDKLLDAMSSWTRMGVISSVDTLEKLAMAGVWRYLTTPIDSAIGRGISHALPGLARRAPRHGFPSIEAEAAALTRNHLATLKAMKDRLRTGKSDLDLLHDKGVKFPPTWMDWVAHTHMAINTPAEMNEYSRSYQQRTAWGIRNGLDVTTPAAQLRISAEAYQDAQRIVFRGDNRLHDSVVAAIQAMERKDKTTGRIPLHGKLGATALRMAIPVSKVPSNVLAETMNRLFGAEIGAVRAAAAYARGVRELPEAQADSIMRQLTQGSPSAALMLLGFLTASYFGGFWTGDKRQPGAPKPMGMKIGGYQVPPKLLHSPWFAALHFGATIRRVADATVRGNKKGITDGILAAALGLLDQVPYVADQAEISRLYEPNTRDQAAADLVLNRAVPGAVRWGAQAMDTDAQGKPVQRKPGTFKQALEADLPGLRSQVPKQQGSGLFGRKR